MRCHYEVLSVEQTVDEAGLKKAYRVAALQWHPDKNQNRLEEADERFKEIQNAYEVLGDRHERAWYDDHRDQILKGGSHQAGDDGGGWFGGGKPADEEDLYSYFTSSCYSGYNDGPKGFYTVYEDLFVKLTRQEEIAYDKREDRGGNKYDFVTSPRFGKQTAAWSEVSAFYAHFLNFVTYKEFTWADEYNPAAAPNRKVRRLMEEENQKKRKAARRAYNDTVRELTAFARKRDKRVAAHQAEESDKRLQREAEDEARRAAGREARAQAAREYQEADWILASEAPDSASDEEPPEARSFECELCDKRFKSEAAFFNHKRSKKHVEVLAAMRAVLQAEEQLDVDDGAFAASELLEGDAASFPEEGEPQQSAAVTGPNNGERRGKKKKKSRNQRGGPDDSEAAQSSLGGGSTAYLDPLAAELEALGLGGPRPQVVDYVSSEGEESGELDEDEMLLQMMSAHVGRKQSSPQEGEEQRPASPAAAAATAAGGGEAGGMAAAGNAPSGRETAAAAADVDCCSAPPEAGGAAEHDPLVAAAVQPAAAVEARAEDSGAAEGTRDADDRGTAKGLAAGAMADNSLSAGLERSQGEKPGKLAGPEPVGYRAVNHAGGFEPDGKPMTKRQKRKQKGVGGVLGEVPKMSCGVCGAEFLSRTQLFKHVEALGHALLRT